MAQVKLNPVFEGFSRQVGDLVFYNRKGKTIVRRKATNRHDPKSEAQQKVRNAFARVVEIWSSLKGVAHVSWEEHTKGEDFTGYNAFIGENSTRYRKAIPLELTKAMGLEAPAEFTALPGKKGEISCTFNADGFTGDEYVTIFSQVKEVKEDSEIFVNHGSEAVTEEPRNITGLEGDKEYFIYAVVTEKPWKEASLVSKSVAVEAAAGS